MSSFISLHSHADSMLPSLVVVENHGYKLTANECQHYSMIIIVYTSLVTPANGIMTWTAQYTNNCTPSGGSILGPRFWKVLSEFTQEPNSTARRVKTRIFCAENWIKIYFRFVASAISVQAVRRGFILHPLWTHEAIRGQSMK